MKDCLTDFYQSCQRSRSLVWCRHMLEVQWNFVSVQDPADVAEMQGKEQNAAVGCVKLESSPIQKLRHLQLEKECHKHVVFSLYFPVIGAMHAVSSKLH